MHSMKHTGRNLNNQDFLVGRIASFRSITRLNTRTGNISRYCQETRPLQLAPLPSSYDELFVIKSIQAFINALNSIYFSGRAKVLSVCKISDQTEFQSIKTSGKFQTKLVAFLLTTLTNQYLSGLTNQRLVTD